jgi:hypothetical protein
MGENENQPRNFQHSHSMKTLENSLISRFVRRLIPWFAAVLVPASTHAGVPLPDLVFYGRVYHPTSHLQITGALPGKIAVRINSAIATDDAEFKSTSQLLAVNGGIAEYYILRLKRAEAGTTRGENDRFVLPGDRIRIFLADQEVSETATASVLVTDALNDLRFLDLNQPDFLVDSDTDGLGDAWEQRYFGSLNRSGGDVSPDGVSLKIAFALGLDPGKNNASRMPFLRVEDGHNVAFYFRQATYGTALTLAVESSEALASPAGWLPMADITPEPVGAPEGESQVYRILVPIDRPHRFFRLTISD